MVGTSIISDVDDVDWKIPNYMSYIIRGRKSHSTVTQVLELSALRCCCSTTYSPVALILCYNARLSLSGVCVHSREAVPSRHPRPETAELASSDLSDSDRLVSETGSTSEHSIAAERTGGARLSNGNDGQIWPYCGGGHKKQRWSFCCLQRTSDPAYGERKHKPVCDIWPILTEDGYDQPRITALKKDRVII